MPMHETTTDHEARAAWERAEQAALDERFRAHARVRLQETLRDLVAPTIAAPFDADATYAVSGRRLNRVLRDIARADGYLAELERKAAAMQRTGYAAQVAAHRTRLAETCALLTEQAAATQPGRDARFDEDDDDLPPRDAWEPAA